MEKTKRYLLSLIIFLLPTQLALHFWPSFALVYGIRSDYLAPALYLSDILIFLFIAAAGSRGVKKKFFLPLAILLILTILNIAFSSSPALSIFRWVKIWEAGLFALVVSQSAKWESIKLPLFLSVLFFSAIGLLQFFLSHSVGGLLYFLGERPLDTLRPGIALFNVGSAVRLRAYSTLGHPNAFAGYILAASFLFVGSRSGLLKILLSIAVVVLLITNSASALVAGAIAVLLFALFRVEGKKISMRSGYLLFLFFAGSLVMIAAAKNLNAAKFPQEIGERVELVKSAGQAIGENFFLGLGANTFILQIPESLGFSRAGWLLQPVHNIYLLVFAEAGIFGFLLFYALCYFVFKRAGERRVGIYLALLVIFVTGLFDHYWLTLQQNLMFAAVVFGIAVGERA